MIHLKNLQSEIHLSIADFSKARLRNTIPIRQSEAGKKEERRVKKRFVGKLSSDVFNVIPRFKTFFHVISINSLYN